MSLYVALIIIFFCKLKVFFSSCLYNFLCLWTILHPFFQFSRCYRTHCHSRVLVVGVFLFDLSIIFEKDMKQLKRKNLNYSSLHFFIYICRGHAPAPTIVCAAISHSQSPPSPRMSVAQR